MSEAQKKPRSQDEIKQQYGQLCAQAGQIQYNAAQLAKELEMVNNSIRDLNLEFAAAKEAEAAAAPPALAAVPAEGSTNA